MNVRVTNHVAGQCATAVQLENMPAIKPNITTLLGLVAMAFESWLQLASHHFVMLACLLGITPTRVLVTTTLLPPRVTA
jgi:hypothetical protein